MTERSKSAGEESLSELRRAIDTIDGELLTALGRRLALCAEVAALKKAHGIPMMQSARVEEVKTRLAARAPTHGLRSAFVRELYTRIIDEACHLEDAIIDSAMAENSSEAVRPRATILGAAGAVGGLFARKMREAGWSVTGIDLRAPAESVDLDAFVRADATAPDPDALDLLARSVCVMICLPEATALHAAAALPFPSSIEIVVDTLSVKTPIVQHLAARAAPWEHLSLNPMFAPPLGFAGQSVAVVETSRRGPRGAEIVALLQRWGASVVEMAPDKHDRMCAVMQAATHTAVLALASVAAEGFAIEEILAMAPPPHLLCLALAARIAAGAPETYWDIQRCNPHAAEARQRLAGAVAALDRAVNDDDEAAFTRAIRDLGGRFGEESKRLTAVAARAVRGAVEALGPRERG